MDLESIPVPAFIFSTADMVVEQCNREFLELYQYTREEATALPLWHLPLEENREFCRENILRESPRPIEYRCHHRRRDGTVFPVLIRVQPLEGTTRRIVVLTDLTEWPDPLLGAVLRVIPDLFFLLNGEGIVLDYHAREDSDLYVPPEHFLNRPLSAVLPAHLAPSLQEAMAKARTDGELTGLEYALDDRFFEARLLWEEQESRFVVIVRDVTSFHRAVNAVREREAHLATMYAQTSDAFTLVNADSLLFVSFNDGACAMVGYTREEFSRLTVADLVARDSRVQIRQTLLRVCHGEPLEFSTELFHAAGHRIQVELALSPVELGGAMLVSAVWKDVTQERDRQRREEERVDRLQLYNLLLGEIAGSSLARDGEVEPFARELTERIAETLQFDSVTVWLPRGTTMICIDGYHRFTAGHSAGEHRPIPPGSRERYRTVSPPPGRDQRAVLTCRIIAGNRVLGEVEFVRFGSRHHWEEDEITFGCQVADQVEIVLLNQTSREATRALERSMLILDRAQTISNTGHWHLDLHSRAFTVSHQIKRIFRLPDDAEFGEQELLDLVHPRDRAPVASAWRRMSYGAPFQITHRVVIHGVVRHVEQRAEVERDEKGEAVAGLGVVRDITEQVQANEALDEYRRNLETQVAQRTAELNAANEAKSAFLSNMSHEIRTPMNAMLGFAHLLRQDPLTDRQERQLEKMTYSAHHLLQLINDILDLSKIEAGQLHLEVRNFSFPETLMHLRALVEDEVERKELELRIHPGDVPPVLRGDSLRVSQVLLNLLSNAVKFTSRGTISLTGETVSREFGKVVVRIVVQDDGIGMTAEQQARLFQPFEQADQSITRRFGGTGLGLAIAARLVALMDGTIAVSSAAGAGSTFTVELPFHEVAEGESAGAPAPDVTASSGALQPGDAELPAVPPAFRRDARVLVVEDNDINQEVLEELLRAFGVECALAGNGREAVHMVRHQPFDLILMDIQMPEMDGLEATRQIRKMEDRNTIPIVAITANVFEHDIRQTREAGMDGHLAKPVDPDLLRATLERWVSVQPRGDLQTDGAPFSMETVAVAGVDTTRGMRNTGGNGYRYARLLRSFAQDTSASRARLADLLEQGDYAALVQEAHAVKGVAATLAIDAVHAAAARVERAARGVVENTGESRDSQDEVRSALGELQEVMEQICTALLDLLPERAGEQSLPGDREVTPEIRAEVVHGVRTLLAHHDAEALEFFRQHEDLFRQIAGSQYSRLDHLISTYEYRSALELLQIFT